MLRIVLSRSVPSVAAMMAVCDTFILCSLPYSLLCVDPEACLCLVSRCPGAHTHSSPTGPHVAPRPRTPRTPACPHLPRAPARALPCLSPRTHVVSANAHIRTQYTLPAVVQCTLHGRSRGNARAAHPSPPAPSRPPPLHPPRPGSRTGPTSCDPLAAARPPAANPGDCRAVHGCWFQLLRATVTNGFPSDVRPHVQPAPP